MSPLFRKQYACLSAVDKQIDVTKLPSSEGAAFDSIRNQHDPECHPKTRIEVLHDIKIWADAEKGKPIFWLNGKAGTGKSTISKTVARHFASKRQLGASFFFKRGESDRGRANRFFTTIATQLVRNVPQVASAIRAAIDATPDISEKQMKDQFEKLLFYPLETVRSDPTISSNIVIVVDALDECESEQDIKTLLSLLSRTLASDEIRLRIFVTSRPELPIRLGFKKMSNDAHKDVVLHEIAKHIIDRDIFAFLKDELARIRDEELARNLNDCSLPLGWPEDNICQKLTDMASPLFIFAATICRFIGDPNWDTQEQLEILLKYSTQSQASKLDQTYLPVLDRLLADCDDAQATILLEQFRIVIGSIIILEEPLPTDALAKLLGVSRRTIDLRLDALHSVLDVPSDPHQPVRILHLSFREFLLDPNKQGKSNFWVEEVQAHTYVARQCLEVLERPAALEKNICKLEIPGTLLSEVDRSRLGQYLPAEVQYACRYWANHLVRSRSNKLWDRAFKFLEGKFLYWLEAMSLMGRSSESLITIGFLRQNISVS